MSEKCAHKFEYDGIYGQEADVICHLCGNVDIWEYATNLEHELKIKDEKLRIAMKALENYADKEKWSKPIEYVSDFGIDYKSEYIEFYLESYWNKENSKMENTEGGYEPAQTALKQIEGVK